MKSSVKSAGRKSRSRSRRYEYIKWIVRCMVSYGFHYKSPDAAMYQGFSFICPNVSHRIDQSLYGLIKRVCLYVRIKPS